MIPGVVASRQLQLFLRTAGYALLAVAWNTTLNHRGPQGSPTGGPNRPGLDRPSHLATNTPGQSIAPISNCTPIFRAQRKTRHPLDNQRFFRNGDRIACRWRRPTLGWGAEYRPGAGDMSHQEPIS
jgi:hypothetical protein